MSGAEAVTPIETTESSGAQAPVEPSAAERIAFTPPDHVTVVDEGDDDAESVHVFPPNDESAKGSESTEDGDLAAEVSAKVIRLINREQRVKDEEPDEGAGSDESAKLATAREQQPEAAKDGATKRQPREGAEPEAGSDPFEALQAAAREEALAALEKASTRAHQELGHAATSPLEQQDTPEQQDTSQAAEEGDDDKKIDVVEKTDVDDKPKEDKTAEKKEPQVIEKSEEKPGDKEAAEAPKVEQKKPGESSAETDEKPAETKEPEEDTQEASSAEDETPSDDTEDEPLEGTVINKPNVVEDDAQGDQPDGAESKQESPGPDAYEAGISTEESTAKPEDFGIPESDYDGMNTKVAEVKPEAAGRMARVWETLSSKVEKTTAYIDGKMVERLRVIDEKMRKVDIIKMDAEDNIPNVKSRYLIMTGHTGQRGGIFTLFREYEPPQLRRYLRYGEEKDIADAVKMARRNVARTRARAERERERENYITYTLKPRWYRERLKVKKQLDLPEEAGFSVFVDLIGQLLGAASDGAAARKIHRRYYVKQKAKQDKRDRSEYKYDGPPPLGE